MAIEVPPAYVARPDDPARSLITQPPLDRELAAVVVSEGRIIGLVTTENLSRAIQRARLRPRPLHETPT